MTDADLDTSIARLRDLIEGTQRIVPFTGAGISTECGIPDFRSPGGFWTKNQPIQFEDFLASREMRDESWRRRFALQDQIGTVQPGRGHRALASLYRAGKVPTWGFAEAPLIVEDRPSARLMTELGIDDDEEVICGLHTGTPLTERSVTDESDLPEMIHLFREGIVEHAGGWERHQDEDGQWCGGEETLRREIRITVLHEIGHHFGLEEEDLAELGYE